MTNVSVNLFLVVKNYTTYPRVLNIPIFCGSISFYFLSFFFLSFFLFFLVVNGCDGKVWVGVADTNIYKRESVVALLSRQYVTIIQLGLQNQS